MNKEILESLKKIAEENPNVSISIGVSNTEETHEEVKQDLIEEILTDAFRQALIRHSLDNLKYKLNRDLMDPDTFTSGEALDFLKKGKEYLDKFKAEVTDPDIMLLLEELEETIDRLKKHHLKQF